MWHFCTWNPMHASFTCFPSHEFGAHSDYHFDLPIDICAER
jgi:hypothetical protein